MITVGVDLAAEPANTALAVINWEARTVRTRLGVPDRVVVAESADARKIGIDCPFGWPRAFVDFVVAHQAFGATPAAHTVPLRRRFAYRATDLWARDEHGLAPLSVSADRIGHAALRCAGLLRELEVTDRSGADRAVETYPAGSLKVWGLYRAGYKKSPGSVADAVLDQAGLRMIDDDRALSEHEVDALVAGITARLVDDGAIHPVPAEHADAARVEGWIALPTGPLAVL